MLDISLLRKLEAWRRVQAENEGVELFRVLPNQTLHAIIIANAKTREALLDIKGIKDRKFAKYGNDLLNIMNGIEVEMEIPKRKSVIAAVNHDLIEQANKESEYEVVEKKNDDALTVSAYLDTLNRHLYEMKGKVRGEVSQFQSRGNAIYFTIKDTEDSAVLSCFMWGNAYSLSGVELEEGMEIIVHGLPQIYKPTGRLSMNATFIELVGEGALKKAYEKLKFKLREEGLFDEENKRELPPYPKKIGLITSREGAVIHDFLNNLGRWGFDIKFINSRVEGVYALRDLREALRYFRKTDIDALVIIRGGGSLESFQAFNNETIVREIAGMPMPVIAGLGHHEDVPLAALAADMMTSTPTAATALLNTSWQEAIQIFTVYERKIFDYFLADLQTLEQMLRRNSIKITSIFARHMEIFRTAEQKIQLAYTSLKLGLKERKLRLESFCASIRQSYIRVIQKTTEDIDYSEKNILLSDPARQLRLGFSIIKIGNKVLRSKNQTKKGDTVELVLSDGTLSANIT